MKETSATGYLRAGANPRRRAQDGLKASLLCENCEQRFSRLERDFANDIFYPIQRDKIEEVQYGKWFLKFCVSISWRVLSYGMQQARLDHFSEAQQCEARDALERWAQFLREEVPHPGRFEQRLALLGAIESVSSHNLPPNVNRYFMRGVEVDIAASKTSAFTYAKLGPFALFGMIDAGERWKGTKVNANEGTVGPTKYEFPHSIRDYWIDRALRHSQLSDKIPQKQQDRIEAAIRKNPERFSKSGTLEAMKHDVDMFGDAAFRKTTGDNTDGGTSGGMEDG
ncbi:MAG TPA: hypothetical protein VGN16_10495 [Acidobacteriaceae bacterium]